MGQEHPSDKSIQKMQKFVASYCEKSGTTTHPDAEVTEAVVKGLAAHVDTLGRPLCPCRFYPDKKAEIQYRTWICACDDMQIYKYCHCLLFVTPEGLADHGVPAARSRRPADLRPGERSATGQGPSRCATKRRSARSNAASVPS